jgi:hypothetical protein
MRISQYDDETLKIYIGGPEGDGDDTCHVMPKAALRIALFTWVPKDNEYVFTVVTTQRTAGT